MLNQKTKSTRPRQRNICPRCRKSTMKPCGAIRLGPRGGLRKVYRCRNCQYRSIR